MNAMAQHCDSFPVRLDVVIRPCREADLPALEWFGLFAPHRQMIRRVFEQQRRGEALMLVVEANGEASGQLWVHLRTGDEDGQQVGEIWAVRVMPCLQRRGIGTRLVAVAEDLLRERGFARAQLRVETDNPAARRLYERLGYALAGTAAANDGPGADDDSRTQWVLAKTLLPAATSMERAR